MENNIIRIALIAPNNSNAEIILIKQYFDNLKRILQKSTSFILEINHWEDTPEGIVRDGMTLQDMIEDTLKLEDSDIVFCIFGSHLGTKDSECGNYRTVCELNKVIDFYNKNKKPDAFVYFKELTDQDRIHDTEMSSDIIRLEENLSVRSKKYKNKEELKDLINFRFIKFILNFLQDSKKEEKNTEILYGLNDYLNKIANLIEKSQEEVLFTSTQMASSVDTEYGVLQREIINASKKFQEKNKNRNHYGIIDSSDRTKRGAIELRDSVEDIILKFNSELTSLGFNFFISDEEHIILRLRPHENIDKYSIYIRNKDLAKKLKQIFLELWHNSTSMTNHFGDNFYIKDIKSFFSDTLSKSRDDAIDFFTQISKIDEKCNALPYTVINNIVDKYILTKDISKYSKDDDFELVLRYYREIIDDNNIDKSLLHEVRNAIINRNFIDYKVHSKTFFFMYFLANYLKVRHALEDIKKDINKKSNYRILDIGGGGGASLLAIYNFINTNNINCEDMHIVDISNSQMNISKQISHNFSSIQIMFYNDDIYQKVDELEQYDLIIGSNIFCELSNKHIINIANKLQTKLIDGGLLLVIEQVESGVYENLSEETDLIQKRYKYQNERYKMSNKQIDILEDILHEKKLYCYKDYVKTGYTLRYALYE